MLIDFARLTGEPPSADVVIIGSGAAGISTADALAARGLSVLILEAGSLRNDRAALGRFFRAGSVRAHSPTELFRRRMAGGATTIWGGRCIPYEPSDFEALDDGNGARWPVGYDEITPFIDRAVPWLHAGTPIFTAAGALPGRPRQIVRSDDPALSLDEIERFSLPMNSWRDRGRALVGGGTDAHLLYNCAVIELVGDGSDRPAYDVRVAAPDGRQATIRCPMLVLASGGLETPRLLLASRSQRTTGVGNEHDLVGRFFMTHVIADAGYLEILDRSGVAQDYEVAADGAYVRRLIKVAPEERARRRLMNMVARPAIPNVADPAHRSAILSSSFLVKRFIIAEYRQRLAQRYSGAQAGFAPHLRNIVRSGHTMPFFGIDWLRRRTLARRKLPALFLDGAASYPLQLIGEQAPLRTSRVSLAEDRDPHGVPRLALDWRYGEDDVRSLTESMEIIARATADNRYARVVLDATEREKMKTLVPQGGHHIGTTRMAERPEEGVTDRWGRVWQSRNLFVAGSALFPRSGIANPTLMIVALAMRTAEHIAALYKGEARLRDAT